MTFIRSLVVFIILAVFTSTIADAQLRRLRERAKERAEERLEQKAEQAVDRQVDKAVDALWDQSEDAFVGMLESALPESKTEVDEEAGVIRQEGREDVEIEENETGPTNAEYVSYRSVTIFELPAQMQALASRFGNARVQEVYLHGDRRYDGTDEAGTTFDAESLHYIFYDHVKQQYWQESFAEMIESAGQALEGIDQQADELEEGLSEQQGFEIDVDVSFKPLGSGQTRGLDVQNYLLVVSATPKDPEVAAQNGTTHVVSRISTADEYAGSETVAAFETKLGENVLESMGGSDFQENIDLSAFADSQLMQAMERVGEEMEKVEGTPVETTTYFVKTQADASVDTAALASETQSESQAVLFQTRTFMTNLSTEPFDAGLLGDRGYTEVESPIKQYLEESGE